MNTLNIYFLISKDRKKNIICIMDDLLGDFLGPPHSTIPVPLIANKIKSLDPLKATKH